jgi:hypothetical protein
MKCNYCKNTLVPMDGYYDDMPNEPCLECVVDMFRWEKELAQ